MHILYNARVYSPKVDHSPATALAIEGDSILAVGADDEILAGAPIGVPKLDLEGKTLWPGLTDSHLHLKHYGEFLDQVDCETPTMQECLERVRQKVKFTPPGQWILGHGWNQNVWQKFGTASGLDEISTQHPIYLTDKALHSGWANSLALQAAGITSGTNAPEGGRIQIDEIGRPTGILFENAIRLVEAVIPDPTRIQLEESLLKAQEALLNFGVTCVHDFDGADCFAGLQDLDCSGKLILRVNKGIALANLDHALAMQLHSGWGNDHLWLGPVKCFADGALGPQTAAMLMPYEQSSSDLGTLLLTADEVFEIGMKAVNNGLSLAIHAIGDRATHEVLNGYGMLREYERRNHLPQALHRIEHLQLLHPDDLLKPRQLNITASMQPQHATSDMFTADQHWGSRSQYAYLYNSMIKSGAHVIFGSDAPVESPNPFLGLHAAVTRTRADGTPSDMGWHPAERVTLDDALTAYTKAPAEITGKAGIMSKIKPGFKADLIVLDQDPFLIHPSDLHKIVPSAVMVNGTWVSNR